MSCRVFEGKEHAEIYRQFRYQPPKALLDRVLEFLKQKYNGSLKQAVDLGCGSGQCTFLLADHFEKVLGTDISEAQIGEAKKEAQAQAQLNNVSFTVSAAESIPSKPESVQLLTACTAAHWFDLPKVYDEGRRVLCSGGVMALFCTKLPEFVFPDDPSKNQGLEEVVNRVFQILDSFSALPAKIALNEYRDVFIPYSDLTREDGFAEDRRVNLLYILGYVRSFSPFQTYCKERGENAGKEFIDNLRNELAAATGLREEDFEKPLLIQRLSFFLVMARLP